MIEIHQGYLPGCAGAITQLHARYYNSLVKFGLPFELKVVRELSDFLENYDATRDGLWLVKRNDEILGSIAIDGRDASRHGAHLRWFIVSDVLRGSGAGNLLLDSSMNFCREKCYKSVYLWTFSGLSAARHLYEKNGFRLAFEQTGNQWGESVLEQRFEWRASK